ncbi:MAG TPA: DUF3466 family protein [Tepidisphaeraceae bacterium]
MSCLLRSTMWGRIAVLTCFFVAASNARSVPPGPYTVTETGLTDTLVPNAVDINNVGQIPLGLGGQAYLYQNGSLTAAAFPDAINNPAKINNFGHVAVTHGLVPYLWTGGPAAIQLPQPSPGANAIVENLNDSDVVVGAAFYSPGGPAIAVMWQNNAIVAIGPANTPSWAHAVDNAGQVVGQWGGSGGYFNGKGFIWQSGTLSTLPDLPGFTNRSVGLDINDHVQIVGWCSNTNDSAQSRATLWQSAADGSWEATGLLPITSKLYSQAFSINNAGTAVGQSLDYFTDPGVATLWQDGQGYDLNSLIPADSGWTLQQARAINDVGQVVGIGVHAGTLHSYLLTPVPEPSTLSLITVMASGILVRRR